MSPGFGTSARLRASLVVGMSLIAGIAATQASASIVAPRSECAGQANVHAPEHQQEKAMHCLINYARAHTGTGKLGSSHSLEQAAGQKSGDVMRCGFSHTACGHAFEYRINQAGYRWTRVGENLGFGSGSLGRPYAIFSNWLRSPGHRANILSPAFRDLGIAVRRGSFSGHSQAAVWVAEFGGH